MWRIIWVEHFFRTKSGEPISNRIEVIAGDITQQHVDAIANVACMTLLPAGAAVNYKFAGTVISYLRAPQG